MSQLPKPCRARKAIRCTRFWRRSPPAAVDAHRHGRQSQRRRKSSTWCPASAGPAKGKEQRDAKTENTQRRREALQENGRRQVRTQQGLQAAHSDEQVGEAEAAHARYAGGGESRRCEARADAAV